MDMMALRRAILTGAYKVPEVEYTATGNPLTFLTDLARPLKSLVANFTPVQSGTGDPSPENVRPITGYSGLNVWHSGKNLFDKSTPIERGQYSSGTFQNDSSRITTDYIPIKPNVDYMMSIDTDNAEDLALINYNYFDKDKTWLGNRATNGDTGFSGEKTHSFKITNSDAYFLRISIRASSDAYKSIADKTLENAELQLELGTTASAYAPYSGTSYPVTFPAMGKNLCGAELEQGGIIGASGIETSATNCVRTKGFIPLTEGQYTISAVGVGQVYFYSYDEDGTFIFSESNGFKNLPCTITVEGNRKYRFAFRVSSSSEDVTPSDVSNVMLNAGSTAETYEPYTNTVYGGSLDLVTGVLTATYAFRDLGTFAWVSEESYNSGQFKVPGTSFDEHNKPMYQGNIVCDVFSCQKEASYQNLGNGKISSTNSSTTPIIRARNTNYSNYTGEQFASAMNGYKMAYELATPVTYQLTPQQVTALANQTNTIWSDANSDCEVTYLKKG